MSWPVIIDDGSLPQSACARPFALSLPITQGDVRLFIFYHTYNCTAKIVARPNLAITKSGASGGFPARLLLRLRHPNSETKFS